jgi:biopolymer transport protein ExbD
MAEMIVKSNSRGKRLSTRVDMTPMVDLGFLLITFFMLTTTMLQPNTMDLVMPAKDGEPMPIPESKALTILLGANDKVLYYFGMEKPKSSSFSNNGGIRDVILARRNELLKAYNKNELMVLIKADENANYKNVVDIMDEMLINHIQRYSMADITPEEKAFLQ